MKPTDITSETIMANAQKGCGVFYLCDAIRWAGHGMRNRSDRIGYRLSNLVKDGRLIRRRPGVFELPNVKVSQPSREDKAAQPEM